MNDNCAHPERVLLRLDCGPGGTQYRRYCLTCWRDLEGAIAHAKARAELGDEEAPLADLEQLHRARYSLPRQERSVKATPPKEPPRLTKCAIAYVEAGLALVPIPRGLKGPLVNGWNHRDHCIIDLESARQLRAGNIGLAHAYSTPQPTCAIDIDDFEQAQATQDRHGIDFAALLMRDDSVQVRSGRANRAKLIYRMPRAMRSVKRPEWGFELRCASENGLTVQDVLPPSIHPDTGKPYELIGDIRHIPEIPRALLALWQSIEPNASRVAPLERMKTDDPVLARLIERNMVRRDMGAGKFAITCPFEAEHTTKGGESEAVYFLPHTGGYATGHFKCLHAHCAARPDAEFLQAIGLAPAGDGGAEMVDLPPSTSSDTAILQAEQSVARASADKATDWPEPLDIFGAVVAPPFRPGDFPPIISAYADSFARAAGFDFSGVAAACLAASAAMLSDAVRVRLSSRSNWFESARLWILLIGGSATGKTPSIRAALSPVYELHRFLVGKWLTENPEPSEATTARPALFTTDATIEKLAEILHDNPRGILYTVDEFDSWIGSIDAYRGGLGSRDRGEWLRLYDGGPHQVDRIKRGSFFVNNWGASLLSATTWATLEKHAKHLPADGLLQRFGPIWLGPRPASDPLILRAEIEKARKAFEERLDSLYRREPGTVFLSAHATEIFDEESRASEAFVEAAEPMGPGLAAHVGKHAALFGRVALIFHELGGESREISGATMATARRFMRRLFLHTVALHQRMATKSSAWPLARDLARSILADNPGTINARACIQSCRAFRSAEDWQRRHAIETLVACGWLEPVEPMRRYGDHGMSWYVNPRAPERFTTITAEHLARRRLVAERLRSVRKDE